MKTIDFANSRHIQNLLEKMNASLLNTWDKKQTWTSLNGQELNILGTNGIDINADDENLKISEEGFFEYKGKKVVVYIRDQYQYSHYKESHYRYHISNCRTLVEMRQKNRYSSRYVVTDRKDGLFLVNIIYKETKTEKKGLEKKLMLCKNCRKKLRKHMLYQSFLSGSDFNLTGYFSHHNTQIFHLPKNTETSAPLSVYPDNWAQISRYTKSARKFICEKKNCSNCQNLPLPSEFLHVHHIDGNPSNNKSSNLKVLCIGSHSEEFKHDHIKLNPSYKKFFKYIENVG